MRKLVLIVVLLVSVLNLFAQVQTKKLDRLLSALHQRELCILAKTQGAVFVLEPASKNYFMHTSTGYYFEFVPEQQVLQIKETDNVYFLKRK